MSTGSTILDQLDAFLKAAEEAASEQGHVENQGDTGTAHPSKGVDDNTVAAPEGDRSAENSADVKATVPGQSVDEATTSDLDGGSKSPVTDAKFTGEDPQNETASVQAMPNNESGKNSEGQETSHPATADFGGKYASVKEAALSLINRINDFHAKVAAVDFTIEKVSMEDDENMEKKKDEYKDMDMKKDEYKDMDMKNDYKKKMENSDEDMENKDEEMSPEEAGAKAAEDVLKTAAQLDEQDQAILFSTIKEAYDDANRLAAFYAGIVEGEQEALQEISSKSQKFAASKLNRILKKAMGEEDSMAYGGDSERPAEEEPEPTEEAAHDMAAEGEEPNMDELQQILQELEAAGVDPELLAQIPPEELAKALAEVEAEDNAQQVPHPQVPEGAELAAG